MVPYDEPIYGFSDEQVSTRGYIDLHTVFRDGTQTKTIPIRFLIVDAPTSYNILLGRPSLNTLDVVVSTPHLAMKFPAPSGSILTVHCDQRLARECYMASLRPQLPIQQTNHIERPSSSSIALSGEDLDPRIGRDVRLEPVEDTTPLELPNGHFINLGTGLNSDERATITPILINNTDLFAWSATDLPGVDPQVVSHKLSIYKEACYVSQKKRKLGEERRQAAKVEADKLLSAGFIEEAQYTTWLSNVVLVKKANGKWRMCVDYTNLNKACPRDAYPLPNIDRLVDGAAGNKVLSFLDAYSGYNQIPMATANMHKTAFITDDANYFYRVMPFGLKNARATYQRLMNKVFSHLTGHCVEVYVDDMVVKSPSHHQHAEDLAAVFSALRQYNLHLNPDKCVFGVDRGKFLGFMLTQRGIEANLEKCKAIIEMRSPTTVKEVQRLIGRLTAISRFLPKLAEQTQPIIQLLKKSTRFTWTDDCEQIFQKLKTTLTSPPIFHKPDTSQPLLVYITATDYIINAALVQEIEGTQHPVYFVSRTLQEPETRYQMVEKLALSLVHAARRLRPYFQNHTITIKTDYRVQKILQKPDLAGRMSSWAVELSEFNIRYEPHGPIKA